jgi:hypothetical protein
MSSLGHFLPSGKEVPRGCIDKRHSWVRNAHSWVGGMAMGWKERRSGALMWTQVRAQSAKAAAARPRRGGTVYRGRR